MSRTTAERCGDVRRLVEAAGCVAGRDALVAKLVGSTGLSREGVELGLDRHLELAPSDEEISALVAWAGDAKHIAVILSANVFVAALRAIAIARAASPSVVVRPSKREPHFARALVEAVGEAGLKVAEEVDFARFFGGEVHVYGRDATIAAVRAKVGERIRVRGHGAGMGVALVGPGANLEEAARALADDMVAFDQRGCLSPRVALVEGEGRAKAFAGALHEALGALETKVPRGKLHEEERAEASRYEATLAFAGEVFRGPTHLVGVASPGVPLTVPPPGRHLHVATVRSLDDAGALLGEIAPVVVALGTDDPERASRIAPAHARISPLGRMQRPPLDGPVDRRPH